MEFLCVEFDGEDCGLTIDDVPGAWRTNETFQLEAGHHFISLSLPASTFSPPEILVLLAGTNVLNPKVVAFRKLRSSCQG
jgi:hypothetical protein